MNRIARTQTPSAGVVRPDVLKLWSPAAVQFVALVAAVLTAGLFAGNWLHNATGAGDAWLARVRTCWDGGPDGRTATELVQHQQQFEACLSTVERGRAVYAFGGMILAAVVAVLVLLVVPAVIARRRRLRPFSPQLAPTVERAAELAERMGTTHRPALLIGPTKLRDAFSFGLPHRYRVALPPKLAVSFRNPTVLEPVLAHELAHITRHDVTYAWLARTAWYAVVPVLALPLVISAARGDLTLAWDFMWRAALLLTIVRLISAQLLRVREHEADLTAASYVGVPSVAAGLGAVTSKSGRPWIGLMFASHPTAQQRVAVLDDVARLARPRFVDGLTTGFLTGLAAPLLLAAFTTVLTGSGLVDIAYVATALLAGGTLGVFVGLMSWRAVLVDRLRSVRAPRWPLAVGVGVGLVLGDLTSLDQTATQGLVEPVLTWWVLVRLILGTGATALVFGLAELWADGAPDRRQVPRVAPACLGAVVLATTLMLLLMLKPAGEQGLVQVAATLLSARLGLLIALAMLGVALIAAAWMQRATRYDSKPPTWLLPEGTAAWQQSESPGLPRTVMHGLLAGATGSAAIICYRAVVGSPPEALIETRYLYYLILGAVVGAAAMLVLSMGIPRVGTGAGLVASLVATLTVTAVVLLLNVALGGDLDPRIILRTLQAALGLALLLSLATAVTGLLPRNQAVAPPVPIWLTIALSIVASITALQSAPSLTSESEVRAYREGTASTLEEDGSRLASTFAALTADMTSTGEQNADRIRAEVLPLVGAMQATAAAAQPKDENLRAAHALVLKSLATAEVGFDTMAEALDAYDPVRYQQGFALWEEANQTWARWRAAVTEISQATQEGDMSRSETEGTGGASGG